MCRYVNENVVLVKTKDNPIKVVRDGKAIQNKVTYSYKVMCPVCGRHTEKYAVEKLAKEAWNTTMEGE